MKLTGTHKNRIRQIFGIKTNPIPMFDFRNKFEIVSVKSGIKLAFMAEGSKGSSNWNNHLTLEKIAHKMELQCKYTSTPPFYFSKKPNADPDFIKKYYQNDSFQALWVYNDVNIESEITKCISGQLNEGYILGYPDCCIKWHKDCRVIEVEKSFEETQSQIPANPKIVSDWQKTIDTQLLRSWRNYPFVPHWACSDCLSGLSRKTEELNLNYRELAMKIGFEKSILTKIDMFCSRMEKNPLPEFS